MSGKRWLFALLGIALLLPGCPFFNDDDPEAWVNASRIWPLKNLHDGQTGFSEEKLSLRGVHWDVLGDRRYHAPVGTLEWMALYRTDDLAPVPIWVDVAWWRAGSVDITPLDGLEPDTEYLLAFPHCHFQPHVLCPDPILFTTASAPRVLGIWRSSDTLVVTFSEDMDPETLYLGHGSVDMLFQVGAKQRSVVKDLNLADFAWDSSERVLRVAPIDQDFPFDLVLGPEVRSASGAQLDADGDGTPDDGNFVHSVYPALLETCFVRDDYPNPCISIEQADSGETSYSAPFQVELDL